MTLTRTLLTVALASSLLFVGVSSQAGTATANLSVTATVVSACVVNGATLSFGSAIDPTVTAVPIDATTTMTVICTSTTPYSVTMNAGTNAGGATNFTSRAVKSGIRTIGYQLYTDTNRTSVWGDGTTGTSALPGTGTGSNQTLTIYGRMPSLTGAVPGTYTDTVTVTVTY